MFIVHVCHCILPLWSPGFTGTQSSALLVRKAKAVVSPGLAWPCFPLLALKLPTCLVGRGWGSGSGQAWGISSPPGCLTPCGGNDVSSWRHVLFFLKGLMHIHSKACVWPWQPSGYHLYLLLGPEAQPSSQPVVYLVLWHCPQQPDLSTCFVLTDSCSINTFEDLLSSRSWGWHWDLRTDTAPCLTIPSREETVPQVCGEGRQGLLGKSQEIEFTGVTDFMMPSCTSDYVLVLKESALGFLVHLKLATTLWRRYYCLHFTKEALRPGIVTCAACKWQSWHSAPGSQRPSLLRWLLCRKGWAGHGAGVRKGQCAARSTSPVGSEGLSPGPVQCDVTCLEPVSYLRALGSLWRVFSTWGVMRSPWLECGSWTCPGKRNWGLLRAVALVGCRGQPLWASDMLDMGVWCVGVGLWAHTGLWLV